MKRLKAIKCKDGWLVNITTSYILFSAQDVYKVIKQEGMGVRTEIPQMDKKGNVNKGLIVEINAD